MVSTTYSSLMVRYSLCSWGRPDTDAHGRVVGGQRGP
jgi:hypothetical protein